MSSPTSWFSPDVVVAALVGCASVLVTIAVTRRGDMQRAEAEKNQVNTRLNNLEGNQSGLRRDVNRLFQKVFGVGQGGD